MAFERSGSTQYQIVTSSTRPSSPTEGVMIYETDTNLVYKYDGAAWRLHGIQTVGHSVLGADTSTISVTLPSITNGLHLRVFTLLQSDTSANDATLQPNADNTAGNYFHQYITGANTSVSVAQSGSNLAGARMSYMDNGTTYWAFGMATIYNYASSSINKTIQTLFGSPQSLSTSAYTLTEHCIWKSTAAITSVTIRSIASNSKFKSGSMATVQVVGSV